MTWDDFITLFLRAQDEHSSAKKAEVAPAEPELRTASYIDQKYDLRHGRTATAHRAGVIPGVHRAGRGGKWLLIYEDDARAWASAGFPASLRP